MIGDSLDPACGYAGQSPELAACRRDSFYSYDRTLRRSPLHDRHVALGAKFAAFGAGTCRWSTPAAACSRNTPRSGRRSASLTSRTWARPTVRGPGAAASSTPASPTTSAGSGRARRSTRCAATPTGGVVDDIIAYLHADDHVFLIPNAANTAEVVRRLRGAPPRPASPSSNEHEDYAVLAVQGPRSAAAARGARPADRARVHELRGGRLDGAADRVPHRLHRRARLRAGRAVRAGAAPCGTRCSRPARRTGCAPPGWPPATPCAPRWAIRCTGRTCRWRSRPVQARVGLGRRLDQAGRSGAATRCSPRRRPARAGCCGAWRRSTGASRARTWRSCAVTT